LGGWKGDLLITNSFLEFCGRIAQPIIVVPKLKEIFEYRKNALIEIFGTY
jgi:hypothetical protein